MTSFEVLEKFGRVVRLTLKNSQKECELEIRLIPKQPNLLVKADGKQISWGKPLDLTQANIMENPPEPRTLEEIHEEWLAEQSSSKKPALDPVSQWRKQKEKRSRKKNKALSEIQKQIDSDKQDLWYEAGQFLKTHHTLQVPEHLLPCINRKETLSWNIENCFSKAKQLTSKKEGARERLEELKKEIQQLEKSKYQEKASGNILVDLMRKAGGSRKKIALVFGRSGLLW